MFHGVSLDSGSWDFQIFASVHMWTFHGDKATYGIVGSDNGLGQAPPLTRSRLVSAPQDLNGI